MKSSMLYVVLLLASLTAAAQPQDASSDGVSQQATSEAAAVSGANAPPDATAEAPQPVRLADRLGYNPWVDGPLTAAIWAGWFGTEALKGAIGPAECRWCTPSALDWSARNAVVWSETKAPRVVSDILLFGVAPLAAVATTYGLGQVAQRPGEFLWDILLIVEAAGTAAALTQLVKFAVARQRPFAHALRLEDALEPVPVDANLSFFSGHSSFTFALAAATATVAHMRKRPYAWVAWAVGLPIATFTAYLRMAGDKHYLTDVAVGSGVGLLTGVLVPAVHDWSAFMGKDVNVAVMPLPGGAAGSVGFAW